MLKSFQVIKDTLDYRIINLLNKTSLSEKDFQIIFNLPADVITNHLQILQEMNFVSCDVIECANVWYISDYFKKTSPLFYELAIAQMKKSLLYQNDLLHLKVIKSI